MFEIKVDPETVNKVVSEAIVKSALGVNLEKSINSAMKECVEGYNSPVKKLVERHITEAIQQVLDKDYRDKIIAEISKRLSNEHIDKIVSASVEKALSMLRERSY